MNKEEKISYANSLIEEITSKFLQKDNPYIILEGFESLREIITLFAKQSNLFESTLKLIEDNNFEEAYVLVRSMLNNELLIYYLCNDENGKRYKEYMIQPLKNQLLFYKNIKEAAKKGFISEPLDLDDRIEECSKKLIVNGFSKIVRGEEVPDTSLLSIRKMAMTDNILFGLYMQFYSEGSKYEHSDFSSLSIYRTPIDAYDDTQAFILDLSRTDPELGERVLNLGITIYSLTFVHLLKHMTNNYPHLIPEERQLDLAKIMFIVERNKSSFPIS